MRRVADSILGWVRSEDFLHLLHFGLSLTLCMIFKICSHFFGNGDFEKFIKILSPQKFHFFFFFFFFFFLVFFNLMHHVVHMHAKYWLNILLKKYFLEKNAF